MQVIYCDVHPFIVQQDVMIYNEETGERSEIGKISLKDLPEFIVNNCKEKDVHDVKLSGAKIFCEKFSKEILNYSKSKYDNFELNVEVLKNE